MIFLLLLQTQHVAAVTLAVVARQTVYVFALFYSQQDVII